jgi:hypothetical protein
MDFLRNKSIYFIKLKYESRLAPKNDSCGVLATAVDPLAGGESTRCSKKIPMPQ